MDRKYFIFDFDSTFITSEGLEDLAEICLQDREDRQRILEKIRVITDLGMEGEITFVDSLSQRLKLFSPNRGQIASLVELLKNRITPSFERNKDFFLKYAEKIYIVSGGFREWIIPVVSEFGIKPENVLANSFIFDEKGNFRGIDKDNPLAQEDGKTKIIKELNLRGVLFMIGDGYTDYLPRKNGMIDRFYVFTENLSRDKVIRVADYILPDLDEFLFLYDLPRKLSYPKSRIRVIAQSGFSQELLSKLAWEGYSVRTVTNEGGNEGDDRLFDKSRYQIVLAEDIEQGLRMIYRLKGVKILLLKNSRDTDLSQLEEAGKLGIMVFPEALKYDLSAQRIINFMNSGDSRESLNFPAINLSVKPGSHRFIHLHANRPGVLAQITAIMADYDLNIEAMQLQTRGDLGYVVTDINREYDKEVITALRAIPETYGLRVLY